MYAFLRLTLGNFHGKAIIGTTTGVVFCGIFFKVLVVRTGNETARHSRLNRQPRTRGGRGGHDRRTRG
ncbi:hypothetical protein BJX99DRAFT_240861 [Aspergillus californicus]